MPDEEPKGQRVLEKLNEVLGPEIQRDPSEAITGLTRCLCGLLTVTGMKFDDWIKAARPALQVIRVQHAESLDKPAEPPPD